MDTKEPNASVWLKRIVRASAWVLFVCIVILVLSGWGITQTGVIYRITFGLVDRRLADSIHRALNVPLAFFFLLHVFINIRLSIAKMRFFRAWLADGFLDGFLIVIGACILWMVIYMEYFRLGG